MADYTEQECSLIDAYNRGCQDTLAVIYNLDKKNPTTPNAQRYIKELRERPLVARL